MIYRTLGKTGLKVSQLGFGAMHLPMIGTGKEARINDELAVPMMQHAFESDVNYIDTAVFYCNADSQRAVGLALKSWRDKIVVSTKNHYMEADEKAWRQHLEDSLRLMDIGYIDIYNVHGINWSSYQKAFEPRIGKWMLKAKDQGLIRHICCSFHDNNQALRNIVDTDFFESITLQYNMLDRRLEDGIAHAHAKGMGVVVMGPIAGGRLGAPSSDVLSGLVGGVSHVPELALRFVLANPNITMALSGMTTAQQVDENVATACDSVSLRPADHDAINQHLERLKKMADLYCTGCEYCMPCPQKVLIPRIFEHYNSSRVYGLVDVARQRYASLGEDQWEPGQRADACNECGACETKCPQKLPIRKQLKEAHKALT